jgi:hypothetical protein
LLFDKNMYICPVTVPKLNLILWTSLRHRGDTEAISLATGKSYMTVHRAFKGSANPELIEYMNNFYEQRKRQTQCYIPQSLQQALSEL